MERLLDRLEPYMPEEMEAMRGAPSECEPLLILAPGGISITGANAFTQASMIRCTSPTVR